MNNATKPKYRINEYKAPSYRYNFVHTYGETFSVLCRLPGSSTLIAGKYQYYNKNTYILLRNEDRILHVKA